MRAACAQDLYVKGARNQPAAGEDLVARYPADRPLDSTHRGFVHQRRAAEHSSIDCNNFAS